MPVTVAGPLSCHLPLNGPPRLSANTSEISSSRLSLPDVGILYSGLRERGRSKATAVEQWNDGKMEADEGTPLVAAQRSLRLRVKQLHESRPPRPGRTTLPLVLTEVQKYGVL